MSTINSYLTFNGNCKEAMKFYQKCLGGELEMQAIGNTPIAKNMPARMKNCILHATLKKDDLVLMGTDMVPQSGLIKGNSVSLMLDCKSEKDIRNYYKKLSEGGQTTYPLETTFLNATESNTMAAMACRVKNHPRV